MNFTNTIMYIRRDMATSPGKVLNISRNNTLLPNFIFNYLKSAGAQIIPLYNFSKTKQGNNVLFPRAQFEVLARKHNPHVPILNNAEVPVLIGNKPTKDLLVSMGEYRQGSPFIHAGDYYHVYPIDNKALTLQFGKLIHAPSLDYQIRRHLTNYYTTTKAKAPSLPPGLLPLMRSVYENKMPKYIEKGMWDIVKAFPAFDEDKAGF